MEGQLVYRPRVETAYPDGDFRRPEEEDDEEEEMVDDTVSHASVGTHLELTSPPGIQDSQRCRLILHRYQRIHAHETFSIRR
jgi:hypothetical protein